MKTKRYRPIRKATKTERPDARRRRRVRIWFGVAALLIVALVALDRAGLLFGPRVDTLDGMRVRITGAACDNGLVVLVDAGDEGEWGVRLLGLDCRSDECDEASAFVRRRFTNARAVLRTGPYGAAAVRRRMHARIEFAGGTDLGVVMLGAGLARVDERHSHPMATRYLRAQSLARQRGVGVWAGDDR